MCSPERLLFLLKYGIAYVKFEKEENGKIISIDQKHIMRYQQMFAALAVREQLAEGKKSGVIWHTQGSGKTALSYYMNKVLTDYFATVNKVPKFYFIVDRLDLLKQASQEFSARGLEVKTANSRKELMDQFKDNSSLVGTSGKPEVTVIMSATRNFFARQMFGILLRQKKGFVVPTMFGVLKIWLSQSDLRLRILRIRAAQQPRLIRIRLVGILY